MVRTFQRQRIEKVVTESEGMINLKIQKKRVGFEINPWAAKSYVRSISSHLLKLVKEGVE